MSFGLKFGYGMFQFACVCVPELREVFAGFVDAKRPATLPYWSVRGLLQLEMCCSYTPTANEQIRERSEECDGTRVSTLYAEAQSATFSGSASNDWTASINSTRRNGLTIIDAPGGNSAMAPG